MSKAEHIQTVQVIGRQPVVLLLSPKPIKQEDLDLMRKIDQL